MKKFNKMKKMNKKTVTIILAVLFSTATIACFASLATNSGPKKEFVAGTKEYLVTRHAENVSDAVGMHPFEINGKTYIGNINKCYNLDTPICEATKDVEFFVKDSQTFTNIPANEISTEMKTQLKKSLAGDEKIRNDYLNNRASNSYLIEGLAPILANKEMSKAQKALAIVSVWQAWQQMQAAAKQINQEAEDQLENEKQVDQVFNDTTNVNTQTNTTDNDMAGGFDFGINGSNATFKLINKTPSVNDLDSSGKVKPIKAILTFNSANNSVLNAFIMLDNQKVEVPVNQEFTIEKEPTTGKKSIPYVLNTDSGRITGTLKYEVTESQNFLNSGMTKTLGKVSLMPPEEWSKNIEAVEEVLVSANNFIDQQTAYEEKYVNFDEREGSVTRYPSVDEVTEDEAAANAPEAKPSAFADALNKSVENTIEVAVPGSAIFLSQKDRILKNIQDVQEKGEETRETVSKMKKFKDALIDTPRHLPFVGDYFATIQDTATEIVEDAIENDTDFATEGKEKFYENRQENAEEIASIEEDNEEAAESWWTDSAPAKWIRSLF